MEPSIQLHKIHVSQVCNSARYNKAKSHNIHRLMRILIHSNLFAKIRISDQEPSEEYGYIGSQKPRASLQETTSQPTLYNFQKDMKARQINLYNMVLAKQQNYILGRKIANCAENG